MVAATVAKFILTILPLIYPEAVLALTVGCFISNLFSPFAVFDVGKVSDRGYMHGGDSRMIRDVIAYYEDENAKELTSIENSFISHSIAYAAEESRLKGGVPVKIQRK